MKSLRHFKYLWLIGLGVTMLVIALPILVFTRPETASAASPWDNVPKRDPAVSHANLISGELKTGPEVTAKCLTCHAESAHEVTQTAHWTWKGDPIFDPSRNEEIAIGKVNLLNNFCIGIQSNWEDCTKCHVGYGWEDETFDFQNEANVDCLVCHDQSGIYVKAPGGVPAEGVDLLAAAKSVGIPTRQNCGTCHFYGGSGAAVKHGDLDESLYYPTEVIDVHMGRLDFQCVDCHKTENHEVSGRSISVSIDNKNQVYCTDCHEQASTHTDARISSHLDTVACQTCHIPAGALRQPTKMEWDWSTAGQDIPEDPHEYLKTRGSFVYATGFTPTYAWFNGTAQRYLFGDKVDPDKVNLINSPNGDLYDPKALIFPFKVHMGKQPYDAIYNYLLQPQTAGEGGYWDTFDWKSALERGSEAAGMKFSGEYGFAPTAMYWQITHMVQPKENALQCADCHGEGTRLDWAALGYPGDPMLWGGRKLLPQAVEVK